MRGVIDRIDWSAAEQYVGTDQYGGVRVQILMRRIADAARSRGLRAGVNNCPGARLVHITLN